jgi:hypothetical protein
MNTVFLAYMLADDHSAIIGIGTDIDHAKTLIKTYAKDHNITITECAGNKFHETNATDGESYHYWIREEKLNTLI